MTREERHIVVTWAAYGAGMKTDPSLPAPFYRPPGPMPS